MTKLTPFQQIQHFNEVFGNPRGNIEAPNWEKLKAQVEILREEFQETFDAVLARDLKETRDGISDVIVVAVGLAHILGQDLDGDLDRVYVSNMTKTCKDEDTLAATYYKYHAMGMEVYHEGHFPTVVVKSAIDQTGTDGKFYPKGKILKSVDFKEPTLH